MAQSTVDRARAPVSAFLPDLFTKAIVDAQFAAESIGGAKLADLASIAAGAGQIPAANLANAPGGPSLTDYQNVVVVDPAGNGDYTTLGAAVAAITDASINNQYVVLVIGETTETNNIYGKGYVHMVGLGNARVNLNGFILVLDTVSLVMRDLEFVSPGISDSAVMIDLQAGNVAVLSRCRVIGGPGDKGIVVNSGTVFLNECYVSIDGQTVGGTGYWLDGTVYAFNCYGEVLGGSGASASDALRMNGGSIYVMGGVFKGGNSTSGQGLYNTSSGVALYALGVTFIATGNNNHGALFTQNPAASRFVGCRFVGNGTGKGANATVAWVNAPFYHCLFENGTLNITANAGTPNGSNIEI